MKKELTSREAAKLLMVINEKIATLKEMERKTATFKTSFGENTELLRPEYDYAATRDQLEKLEQSLMQLKHYINDFNCRTLVGDTGLTIDQVLMRLPYLSAKVNKLRNMSNRLVLEREENSYRQSNIIEYTNRNYDVEPVKADFEAASQELSALQLALDTTNSTVKFEVELDMEF